MTQRVFLIALAALCSAAAPAQELTLPADGFVEGWVCSGPSRDFSRDELFNHIDGGAEIFLEFGFEHLTVQRFKSGRGELAIEVYRMDSPDAALGIYLTRIRTEAPLTGIRARNSGDRLQVTAVKGNYLLLANNFAGSEQLLPVMADLASAVLDQIPESPPTKLFDLLPGEGLIAGSRCMFRGPYGLQRIFTLGDGDILLQKGKTFGVAAEYAETDSTKFTRILVSYPDSASASQAYQYLLAYRDPTIRVTEEKAGEFRFKDFQGKSGTAALRGNTVNLRLRLSRIP